MTGALDVPRLSPRRRALLKPFVRWGGTLWLVGASLTWTFCPPPNGEPAKAAPSVHYANLAGYYVECISLWPLIAYASVK
jgi:hypothetical protein